MADINDKSTNKAASPEATGDVLTKDALKAGSGHSRRKWIAAVVVLAALAAGGAWYAGVFTSAKAPSYRTAAVENGSLVVTVTANGNAPAEDSTEVINTERFWVQAGTFATNEEAEAMRASIAFIGLDAQISSIRQAGKRVYLVRIGPFDTADNAEEIRQSLADNAIQGTVIHQPN